MSSFENFKIPTILHSIKKSNPEPKLVSVSRNNIRSLNLLYRSVNCLRRSILLMSRVSNEIFGEKYKKI